MTERGHSPGKIPGFTNPTFSIQAPFSGLVAEIVFATFLPHHDRPPP